MPAVVVQATRKACASLHSQQDTVASENRKRKPGGASPSVGAAAEPTPRKAARKLVAAPAPSASRATLKPISESSSQAAILKPKKAKSEPVLSVSDGGADKLKQLQTDLESSQEDNASLTKQIEEVQAELQESKTKARDASSRHKQAAEEISTLKRKLEEQQAEAARVQAEQKAEAARLQAQAAELAEAREKAAQEMAELRASLERAREEVTEQGSQMAEMSERSRAQEELRKKMHETIQDLKGNIRVFCRVRGGSDAAAASCVRCPPTSDGDSSVLELHPPVATGKQPPAGSMTRFQFDRVFDASATQADVFAEVSQLTQSALDGFKVCIFAYGQTGSGKTFTMDGPRGKGAELRGVVPRAAEQAFETAEQMRSLGWDFSFELSCLEIYNEELRDLLGEERSKKGKEASDTAKLKLIDSGSEVSVPGLSVLPVANQDELHAHLARAAKARATASTKCNDQSSRSHFLFRLRCVGVNEASGQRTDGELNLVDLAGSERVKESGVKGAALAEAQNINKSLSALGDVIAAMATKAKHVPYRNSRLTHLLSNALRGKAKTLMFVNVAPTAEYCHETKSSLMFAQKVNGCDVGPAARCGGTPGATRPPTKGK